MTSSKQRPTGIDGRDDITHPLEESETVWRRAAGTLERFRSVFEAAATGIAFTDPEGHILDCNAAFAAMLGAQPTELTVKALEELTAPADHDRHREALQQLRDDERGHVLFEQRFLHPSGELVWARMSMARQRDAAGAVASVVVVAQDITQQKRAERALLESQALLRMASRLSHMGAWAVTLPGFELTWSDEVAAIHGMPAGYTPDVSTAINFYAPESRPVIEEVFGRCVELGEPFDRELRLTRADGKAIWVRSIGEAVRDASGTIVRVQGAFQDISDRKEAELRELELHQRLSQTLENLGEGFFTLDGRLRFTYVNSEAERMLAQPRAALLGRSVWDAFPEAVGSVFEEQYRRVIAERLPVHFEERFAPHDAWYEVHAHPIRSDGLAVYFRDVTERRAIKARVRQQAALLDQARDAIIVCDLEGEVTYWNEGAKVIYGWGADEAVGRPLADVIQIDEATQNRSREQVSSQGAWTGEMEHRSRDGAERVVLARWSAVHDDRGEAAGILAIHTDVTEHKHLERQLLRAQRLESIGTLAGGIAHDLNNVLTPILMAVDSLQSEVTSEEGLGLLRQLETSGERGASLVRQVLTFARGGGDERQPLLPTRSIDEVAAVCRDTFPRNIAIRTQVDDDSWAILADPTQIHQVLMNLCVNARDAMPEGGQLTIGLRNEVIDEVYAQMNAEAVPGRYVVLSVSDTGEGIPPEVQDRIFEPFFSTKEYGKGTGLGLSTTFTIVREHKGFIHVYSEVGQGTELRVHLPALLHTVDDESITLRPKRRPRGQGELVLVVDDDENVRDVTARTLERFGYRAVTASQGAEAVAIYAMRGDEIAVVLTDMSMPVMDGPATVAALKTLDPIVRIIGSSGLDGKWKAYSALEAGVTHFIAKPYNAETLLETLHEVLRGSRPAAVPEREEEKGVTVECRPGDPCDTRGDDEGGARSTVLVVDDEPAIVELLTRVLDRSGNATLSAASGEEALEILERCDGQVDLLLTDFQLNGMTGIELARRVRARWPEVGFVFMSGDPSVEDVVEDHGPLVSKPVGPRDIQRALAAALADRGRDRASP